MFRFIVLIVVVGIKPKRRAKGRNTSYPEFLTDSFPEGPCGTGFLGTFFDDVGGCGSGAMWL
jgi:hypothetical protein